MDSGGSCLINALGRDQHSGADGGTGYGRAGHIPGATNVPSGELTDPDTGLYRPADELAALFEAAGADPSQRVVTYCGGGIAASNDAFVLAMLGYEKRRGLRCFHVGNMPPIRSCRWWRTEAAGYIPWKRPRTSR